MLQQRLVAVRQHCAPALFLAGARMVRVLRRAASARPCRYGGWMVGNGMGLGQEDASGGISGLVLSCLWLR